MNTAMRRYCSHRGLIRTTTSADDFKMNGRCEAMVGRLKSATRTMLAAAGLGPDHWSFAMRHVVARAQSDLLRQLGLKQPTLPPFATKVYVKRRSSGSVLADSGDPGEVWNGWSQSALESARAEEMEESVVAGHPPVLWQGQTILEGAGRPKSCDQCGSGREPSG